jgi:shikimate kinase
MSGQGGAPPGAGGGAPRAAEAAGGPLDPAADTPRPHAGPGAATGLSVVLVGFMGAGKSTVGQALAERCGLPFVDCDALIVREAGPIDAIFASSGEAAFRVLERDVVLRALAAADERPQVVALGGGAVLSGEVRRALARFAHVVWLSVPVEEAWRRVGGGEGDVRPLARDEQGFRRLYDERAALYAAVARLRVASGASRAVASVVDEIVAATAACGAGRRR